MVLLQVVSDSVSVASQATDGSLSVVDITLKGGFMLIPIVICLIAAGYLFVERLLAVNKASTDPTAFINKIKELVVKGDILGAKKLCSQNDSPIARMLEKGVSRIGTPLRNIETAIENIGKIEIFKLEKNLSVLATLSGLAPMLGFLGTVVGMVQGFKAISRTEGSVSPELLSSGVYMALVTTIAGLIVGMIAYVSYNYLVTRVQKVIHKMEYTAIDFMDLLQEPR